MGYSVQFNGKNLGELINVLRGFKPLSGPEWEPLARSPDGPRRGTDYLYTSRRAVKIPMPFTMLEDLEEKHDRLMKVLNVSEPKKLTFESMPDRYFMAIPYGDLEFEESGPLGTGTITWIIPDGVAHAIEEKTFPAEVNANGTLEATIVNNGTESVPISYEIEHQAENGYIGIISDYGAMQYGAIEERDTEVVQKSSTLIDLKGGKEIYDTLTQGGVFISPYINNGAFQVSEIDGIEYLEIDHDNVGSGDYWHGAGGYIPIPADDNGHIGAKNFKVSMDTWFQGTKARQRGSIDLCVSSGNQIIASIQIWDSQTGSYVTNFNFYVGDKAVKKDSGLIAYVFQSPRESMADPITIQKSGELFLFECFGTQFSVREPLLEDVEADQISIFIGAASGDTYSQMTWACIENISFRSDSVDDLYDIPNRYPAGSKIYIDGEERKVYIDEVATMRDEVIGTKYFDAPPGETKVEFTYSDWCAEPPVIVAKIREAYL